MSKIKSFVALIAFSLLSVFFAGINIAPSQAAELTTWQAFIRDKCSGGSADSAERCAETLETELKTKCNEKSKSDTYTKCWRKFINDKGGTAGADSSPYEEENSPTSDGCGGIDTVIVKCDEENGIWGILLTIITILTAGVAILAVGGFVYGGILYATAEDKSDQVSKAKQTIFNVVIGLVAFALMFSLLQFIIPGGVFNRNFSVPESSAPSNPGNGSNGGGGNGGNNGDRPNGDNTPAPSGNINTIRSVHNMRDASASNSVIKPRLLYRSPELAGISRTDKKTLSKVLSGGTVVDMRLGPGRASSPDPELDNVDNIAVPADLINMDYRSFVNNSSNRAAFGRVINIIANSDGPVLVHCTHGKDRTGWVVAMVMYSLGATDAQVMSEYLKSNASGETVSPRWLNAGLSEARADYNGSIMSYIKDGLGVSDQTLKNLREKLKA